MFPETVEKAIEEHGYEIMKYLNKGGFGTCYIVKSKKYDMKFVCKVSNDTTGEFKRELNALTTFDHQNIVRVYDAFTYESYLFLILEYCPGGSLYSLLKENKKLPINQIMKYTKEIIEALEYIHSLGFAHCDLKPSNVLIDEFGRAKLCDFGLTILTKSGQYEINRVCGSVHYMAPEIALNREYDPKVADIWSLGVMLYFLGTGKLPYNGEHIKYIIAEMKFGKDELKNLPVQLRDIVEKCLKINPDDRASIKQLAADVNQRQNISPVSKIRSKTFGSTAYRSIIKPHLRGRIVAKSN